MANINNVISTPIWKEKDIQFVLGIPDDPVALAYVVTNGQINKFAKYKPFRSVSPNFATDDGDSGTYLTDREKARKAALYGFASAPNQVPTPVSVSFTGTKMNNVSDQFAYSRPNGNPYWFRGNDFDGYRHDAVAGFKIELQNDSLYYDTINGAYLHFGLSSVTGFDSKCLSPHDVLPYGDRYAGVLISCEGKNNTYFCSSGKTFSELRGTVGWVLFSGRRISGADPATYSYVPDLEGWAGENVTIAAVLAPHGTQWADTSTAVANPQPSSLYSLELSPNIDRLKRVSKQYPMPDVGPVTLTPTSAPAGTKVSSDPLWVCFDRLNPCGVTVSAPNGLANQQYTFRLSVISGGFVDGYTSLDFIDIVSAGTFPSQAGTAYNLSYSFSSTIAAKVAAAYPGRTCYIDAIVTIGGRTATHRFTVGTW